MNTYQIIIEYAGTNFVGWQIQKNGISVQEIIQKVVSKLVKTKITLSGSGRTDAGVHALAQCANFNLDKKFTDYQILNGLNFHLGNEKIKISKVENVSEDFNARFSKNKKTYCYQVYNTPSPSVLEGDYSIHVKQNLDVDAMNEAIVNFKGKHDFSSFRGRGCQAKSPIKSVDFTSIEISNDKIIFIFQAQSFLYQQIRIMVGTLLEIGLNNKKPAWINELLTLRNRVLAGPTMPPRGLILKEITY